MKRRRVHLQIEDTPDGFFAACAPQMTLLGRPGRGLAWHPQRVTCSACKTVILRAQRAKLREAHQ